MIAAKIQSAIKSLCQEDNLKARCVRSSVVLGSGAIIAKLLGFGSKVVLTRLLISQEIGLMVMILTMTQIFEVLTEVGIKQSVIQNKKGSQAEYLNMAWWFQCLRAIGLYAAAFIVTPWLCEFYFRTKSDVMTNHAIGELILLVRIAFLNILFNGFISPGAYVLEKEFKFGRAVVITQGGLVLGSVVTVIFAFLTRDIWAIVIGFTATGFTRCLVSYILCPFMPRLEYDRESFHELCHFARGMLGLPVLTYMAFNIDVLVAGKLVPTSLVGYYGMALMLAFAPRDIFIKIVSPILLPAFAEKQNDNGSICRAMLKITRISALLLIPVTALAVICGRSILAFVFKTEYSAAAVQFGLLFVYVLFLIQGNIFASVFFGIGQPGKHRTFVALRVMILTVLIYPGIKLFGLTGAAAVLVLAGFTALCVQVIVVHRIIGLNIFDYVISWVPGVAMAIPVLAVVVVVRGFTHALPMVSLTAGLLSCIVVSIIGLASPMLFKRQRLLPNQAGRTAVEVAGGRGDQSV